MRIVDFHTHFFKKSIVKKAIASLEEATGGTAFLNGDIDSLISAMDKNAISKSISLSVATKPDQVLSINNWLKTIKNKRIVLYAAFYPGMHEQLKQLELIKKQGFKGIKLHPEYQNFIPEDKAFDPIYAKLSDIQLPVIFHAGVDPAYKEVHSNPAMFAGIKKKFPDLIMILAHLGGFLQWGDVLKHICGRDIYMDTSFIFHHIDNSLFIKILNNHDPNKIFFGTDTPWAPYDKSINFIKSLDISDENKNKIFFQNAEEFLEKY